MSTLVIEINDQKAYRLLKDLEDLKIITIKGSPQEGSLASLRERIKTQMSGEEIDTQLKALRSEWKSAI